MDKRKSILCLVDAIIFFASFVILVLFDNYFHLRKFDKSGQFNILISFFIMLSVNVIVRFALRIYKNIWRYAVAGLYLRLLLADMITGIIVLGINFFFRSTYIGFSATFFVISFHCLVSMGARLIYQYIYAKVGSRELMPVGSRQKIFVAIVGAGNIGASLADELLRNTRSHYTPLFFIDNDPAKCGQILNGLPIKAEDENIINYIRSTLVQEILIALPDLPASRKQQLYDLYSQSGCKVKLYDYPFGNDASTPKRRSLREIRIEDLLFRDTIDINDTIAKDYYAGKTVLVTGGGGSIGSELCRQIARLAPKKLIIFDIYENNAYDIQQELILEHGAYLNLEVVIGSVRDVSRLNEVFEIYKPQIVLHAAAHKHVPLMEKSPAEAIKNNVLGTYNCANCAEKHGVEKFVLISTDKAVNPTNIMGASKRMCEMIVQCRQDSKTKFVAVRFGNVLGSNGSVIPLFSRQIENGGPVTITDKRIIRYFMTIPEASQLVLQCGAIAKRGELFVLDMGKPVRIYDLAVKMIELAGYKPNHDIMIQEIGLREGEKLYEELLIKGENLDLTENELIFIEKDMPFTRDEVENKIAVLRSALADATPESISYAFHSVVPTYKDPSFVNKNAELSEEMKMVESANA